MIKSSLVLLFFLINGITFAQSLPEDKQYQVKGYFVKEIYTKENTKREGREVYYFEVSKLLYVFDETEKENKKIEIKVSDCKIKVADIDALLKSQSNTKWKSELTTIECKFKYGSLDIPDSLLNSKNGNTYAQTRSGEYITISKIYPNEELRKERADEPIVIYEVMFNDVGYILKKAMENKIGKQLPVYDYFFVPQDTSKNQVFIKINHSRIQKSQIDAFSVDKIDENTKLVKVIGSTQDGLWDTDNPNQQSRKGEFLVISSISEIVNGKSNVSKWNMLPKDSVLLTKLWDDFLLSFEKGGVVFLQVNSAKKATISLNLEDCENCESGMSAAEFSKKLISLYQNDKDFNNLLKNTNPNYGDFNNESMKNRFYVSYPLPTPEGMEQATLFFDFVKKKGKFKLISIWTIP